MKYFIYIILISGFIGFVTYATIETNKTVSQNVSPNASAILDANIPSVDTPTVIIPNNISPTDNVIKKSTPKINYENREREDD
jgi:hypothetical protein